MILKRGNVFDSGADYIGITTNSIVKKNGELVMEAGIAKEAKKREPHLPELWGSAVKALRQQGGFYGILSIVGEKYFAFQTKRNWRNDALIDDVVNSAKMLKNWTDDDPDSIFALPFPAINNGGLDRNFVLSHLERVGLPDNVHIYEWVK